MAHEQLLYLSQADVESVGLEIREIINLLEIAFREKGHGRVEMPPKPGIHTREDAFIHAMPAYIPALESAGIKWVSGYPENMKRNLPYISGLLILNDVETGIPIAVMDCVWITAYRTAAATALAAKYLARADSEIAGILACGVQGRTNLEALVAIFPIKKVYAYDIVASVQEKFVTDMSSKLGVEVIGVNEPKHAVQESDLIVTSGPILKHPTPTIERDWVKQGAFGSAVDFDSYWTPEAMSQMDKIST
ncbi:MAG: ornithine cyclodeaminase family protein, partial [Anaerolineales bacterium]|nr:ornithine cyclodeaminase family protein [Anaerolineales bacterium]